MYSRQNKVLEGAPSGLFNTENKVLKCILGGLLIYLIHRTTFLLISNILKREVLLMSITHLSTQPQFKALEEKIQNLA